MPEAPRLPITVSPYDIAEVSKPIAVDMSPKVMRNDQNESYE